MKKRFLPFALALIMIFTLLSISACSSSKNQLIGEWELLSGRSLYFFGSRGMEFFSDGTVYGDDGKGEWSVEGNKLTVKTNSKAYNFTYSISDNKLTITDSDDDTSDYKKK